MSKQIRFEVFVEDIVFTEDRVVRPMVFAEDVSVVEVGRPITRWEIFKAVNRDEMKDYKKRKEEAVAVAQPLPKSLSNVDAPVPQLRSTRSA